MKRIKQLICRIRAHQADRYKTRLRHIEKNAVQLREFHGKTYIAYNNVPLVNVESLDTSPIVCLEEARVAFRGYMIEQKYEREKYEY